MLRRAAENRGTVVGFMTHWQGNLCTSFADGQPGK
jgi:hypothetical protein